MRKDAEGEYQKNLLVQMQSKRPMGNAEHKIGKDVFWDRGYFQKDNHDQTS
jgi:hypothetical protein